MAIDIRREMDLFDQLIAVPEGERQRALAEMSLDEESRKRLIELLGAAESAEQDLEESVKGTMRLWGQSGVLEAGMEVGRFRVVRELGKGGMGEVWLVEYEEEGVERRGALKVLRRQMLGPQKMLLWERERRLLARLGHPYIASMIESGTLEGGLPYLLMEYVEGERLDEAVKALGVRERVEILRKVCDAVAASHRQMVVHRDLKPGNILITRDGLPKLVDFGIAQAMDMGPGMLGSGTEAYASPEQLAGEIATMATDVYALGRILERVAGEGGEELQAIGRKATAREPGERYAAVEELEADLQRWLEKRPVRAFGGGWRYRAQCFVRRQPWATAGVSVAVGLMIVAGVVAWQQYQRAQKRAGELRSLAGTAIFELDQEVRKLPGSMTARKMLLETATGYLENLEAAARDDRSLKAELADAYDKTATLMHSFSGQSLGKPLEALKLAEKAYQLRQELGHLDSQDLKVVRKSARTAWNYAEKLRLARKIPEADRAYEQTRILAERWLRLEPGSWEALENQLTFDHAMTRRLRFRGVEPARDNQRKVVQRLEDLKRLGAPPLNYWRQVAAQNQLMATLLADGGEEKNQGEFAVVMARAVRGAEELYRVEATVVSSRMLSMAYNEYMVQWVEIGLPVGSEMQRVIRMNQELLDSPQLPDRGAAFWLMMRAEHEMGKAWAAIGWKDWARARKQMAIAREMLERVEPKGQMMVAVRKAQMAEAEQKFLAGK